MLKFMMKSYNHMYSLYVSEIFNFLIKKYKFSRVVLLFKLFFPRPGISQPNLTASPPLPGCSETIESRLMAHRTMCKVNWLIKMTINIQHAV